MGADKLAGGLLHDLLIQVLGIEPGTVDIEGVLQAGVVNQVGILLPGAGTDGVEILMDFKGLRHHHILRQVGIQGIGQTVHRDGGGGAEIRHIALGVDPRVSPAAAGDVDAVAHHHGDGLLHGLLDGRQILLHLPAVIGSSEIAQKNRNISHGGILTDRSAAARRLPRSAARPRRRLRNHSGGSAAASSWSGRRRPDSSDTPWR